MRHKILIACLLLLASASAPHAQRPVDGAISIESLLAVGKGAGACGIMTLQVEFQHTTKMASGDEFIVRFWTTEAARLGMTLQGYIDHCKQALSAYGRLDELTRQADK